MLMLLIIRLFVTLSDSVQQSVNLATSIQTRHNGLDRRLEQSHNIGDKFVLALELTTSDKYVQGYMAPIGMTEFTLVSQYDVYDTKGNLIRENQTAANKININQIFSTQLITVTEFERGTRYTLKLKVNPTYLYMLSEPDLDNPTVEVGS